MVSSAARLEQAQEEASRYTALTEEYEAGGGYTYQRDLELMAEGLGLSKSALDTPSSHASGGERTRAALAKALLGNPDLLVLDEPTNHLDIASREVLLDALQKFEGTLIFVSHDRHFLHELAEKVYEVDKGSIQLYPGNYKYYLEKTQKA